MLLPMSGALLLLPPMSGALLSSVVPMSGALLYSVVPMSSALLSSVAADVRWVSAWVSRCSSCSEDLSSGTAFQWLSAASFRSEVFG